MHRQDAHLAAAVLIEVALDLAAARLEPVQEALQRGALGPLVLQRPRQQLVDRVGRFAAQPFQQAPTAAFGTEGRGKKVERRDVVGTLQPAGQPFVGGGKQGLAAALAQRPPQMGCCASRPA